MNTSDALQFERDKGFWSDEEQQAILDHRGVAIAGVGGEGYIIGLALARMGIQHFVVADPEVFDATNINRVPGATELTVGRNKAEVFREQVLAINPDAVVEVYAEGVTRENVAGFLGGVALLVDGSDLNQLDIGTMLAREARAHDIPTILSLNLGFAALVTSFDPRSRWTFERFMGIPEDMPLDEVAKLRPDFSRCLPYLPSYGDLRTLQAVREEGASLPSVVQGVEAAAALATTEAFLHIVGGRNHRSSPVWAPHVAYVDPYARRAGVINHPRVAYYRSLAGVVVRSILRRNPRASYTAQDRQERALSRMNRGILSSLPDSTES